MPGLLIRASCRKDSKTGSFLKSSPTTKSVKGLNWTDKGNIAHAPVPQKRLEECAEDSSGWWVLTRQETISFEKNSRVGKGENAPPCDVRSDKRVPAPTCMERFSLSHLYDQPDPFGQRGCGWRKWFWTVRSEWCSKEWCASSARANWLIAVWRHVNRRLRSTGGR